MQRSGIPDILACVNGNFVAIEVKSSTGEPSELQKYNIRKISESKGYAIITYPEDFDKLKKDLDKLCNTRIQG